VRIEGTRRERYERRTRQIVALQLTRSVHLVKSREERKRDEEIAREKAEHYARLRSVQAEWFGPVGSWAR